jgi:hypothetical protein
MFLFAAIWSIVGGAWILLTPITVENVTATYAAIYSASAVLVVTKRRAIGAIASGLCLLLTYMAGFSIGRAYFPAALAILAGLVLLASTWILRRSDRFPA